MAYREIPHDDRVKAAQEYLETKKLKEIAKKYKISEATILDDYKFIIAKADEILKKNALQRIMIKTKRKMKKFYKVFLEKLGMGR